MSVTNQIQNFFHCRRCVQEAMRKKIAPANYARLAIGLTTDRRIQVWCERHSEHVAFVEVSTKGFGTLECEGCRDH